ncbi:hypothetical protein [Faecalibacterium prausnitzii]|uniref:hypothetical protein n=1 Tax=Faecalibacterium prausnitzii TaxID=853 RepID=UPI00165152F0|nr:hypothetical protein [Faecalibacterium prausnitzii]
MPQESAEEIASARSGVGFSESFESTSARLNRSLQEKSTTFFKNLLDKTLEGGYNSTR